MKKAQIEADVAGFVEKLETILGVCTAESRQSGAIGNQGIHPSGEGATEAQVPSLRPQGIQDIQSVRSDEVSPIKRLDGEVTRLQKRPFAGGAYCEVWVGQWVKDWGKGRGVEVEKVSLSPTTSILLTGHFVGCPENISNRLACEGA